MKILLDEAVEIVKSLSEVHLNYLSLIFLCKEIRVNSINSIDLLKEHCEYIWLFRIFTYEAGNLMLEMVYYEKLVL